MPSFTIHHDKNTGDVFLEAFLIDATHLNNKGWKVSYDDPADFDRRVQSSLGHPLVLFERKLSNGEKIWDHPVSETGSVTEDIEYQKPYTIGKAVHNKKIRDGLWHSSYKIIHEGAKRFLKTIKESTIDLFTSPYISRDIFEDRQNIKRWAIIHNAIVSDPANGKQLAKVDSICEGDPSSTCSRLFASNSTPDDDDSKTCGYCLGDSLKEYVTSHSFKSEKASNNMSENPSPQGQEQQGQQNQQTSNPNTITNDNGNNQQQLLQQQKPIGNDSDVQNNDAQQKTIAELTEKIKSLESQNKSVNTFDETTKKQEARIADLEKKLAIRERTGQIEKLLTQAIDIYRNDDGSINEKEYNANLDELVKEPYKLEHIQELIQARYVLHQQAKGKLTNAATVVGNKASNTSPDKDVTSQVGESASRPYTEMNGSIDSVTNESKLNDKLSQPFVNILTHLGNERFQLRSKLSNGGLV